MKIPVIKNHNYKSQRLGHLTIVEDQLIIEFDPPINYDIFFDIFPTIGCVLLDAEYNCKLDVVLIKKCRVVEFSLIT